MRSALVCKRMAAVCLVLLLGAGLLSACAGDAGGGTEPTDELVLYCPPSLSSYLVRPQIAFTSLYPEVRLTVRDFADDESYQQVLRTELMAGKGPDLVLFRDYDLWDVYKMMDAGVLCDLDPFLEADESFALAPFYQRIFNGGYYKEQRLFIPLSFETSRPFLQDQAPYEACLDELQSQLALYVRE